MIIDGNRNETALATSVALTLVLDAYSQLLTRVENTATSFEPTVNLRVFAAQNHQRLADGIGYGMTGLESMLMAASALMSAGEGRNDGAVSEVPQS